jgi:hypothetical protein
MKWNWAALGVAAVLAAAPAFAQQIVGTSVVGGRPVQIMSDYTWRYVSPAPAGCENVQDGVLFCGKARGWERIDSSNKEVTASYRRSDRSYAMLIVERIGSEQGMTPELMRRAILGHAASATGLQAKDITTFGVESKTIGGIPAETISYAVKMDGLPLVFTNTVFIEKNRTVQIATYGLGVALTDEMKADHKSFVEATQLK